MATFAPAYRPTKHQQPLLIRQQNLENKKRKRGEDDGSRTPSPEPDDASRPPTTSTFHPVNKTDPYFIASHSRELPIPVRPFPHAAVPAKPSNISKKPTDEVLASLNPPLYLPSPVTVGEDKSSSLKHRHLDNLTTILHRSLLKRDWTRAERAWSLLIRTEIQGRGIDVRRSGRWGIGAELLMRRGTGQRRAGLVVERGNSEIDEDGDEKTDEEQQQQHPVNFSDEGFKLARDYYERLILQYPHTVRTMHTFNATVIYPVLFNVWIYEVQNRSKRARQDIDINDEDSLSMQHRDEMHRLRSAELEQALPIAQRMDELLLSPPYDTHPELRHLRRMVARWIADLHNEMADYLTRELDLQESEVETGSIGLVEMREEIERHRGKAKVEEGIARSSRIVDD